MRKVIRWVDLNAERVVMIPLYVLMGSIIGGEVVVRFLTDAQTQWGGTLAIHAFVFLSWLGCAYHVRRRSHLAFDAVRKNLAPLWRFVVCMIDDLLWVGLASIVIVYSLNLVQMQRMLQSTMEGAEFFPLWIVTATVPFSWAIIALRAVQSLLLTIQQFRCGEFEATPGALQAAEPLNSKSNA